jgi:5-methylcytosine-specific restriction endonuclease McrA
MREYQKARRAIGMDIAAQLAAGERYRKNNLAKFATKERIRRATKRGRGRYRIQDWERRLNRFGGLCAYCQERKATTADHVVPLARGGTNFIGNILPACVSCNSSKQGKLLVEWSKWKRDRKKPSQGR